MLEEKTCFLLIVRKSEYIVGRSYVSVYFTAFLECSLILGYSICDFNSGFKTDTFARAGKYTRFMHAHRQK